jgi:hypothetical protein
MFCFYTSKNPRNQESTPGAPTRIKTNYEIGTNLVRALKRHAVDQRRKIYEVLEEAISEYIERQTNSTEKTKYR